MQIDFTKFFSEYERLANDSEKAFHKISQTYPNEVKCSLGCADCCYAMFDLTLIEAMYINHNFKNQLSESKQQEILEKANIADRQAYKIKKRIFQERQKGVDTNHLLEDVGKKRVRCPLLTDDNQCELYAFRPITCRLYGVPLQIGEETHTCGLSGFEPGKKYSTVFMDKIQDKLLKLSEEMVASMPTQNTKLAEVLVPLSMALLTEYDEEYLGIIQKEQNDNPNSSVVEWTLGTNKDED